MVEDQKSSSDILCHKLLQHWDVEIHLASSYTEAKDCLKLYRHDYLVAVCDLNLPDAADGAILDLMDKAEVRSIALTASSSRDAKVSQSRTHMVDFVHKASVNAYDYTVGLIGRLFKNQFFKVLVVEDSKTALMILEERLKLLNFDVYCAEDGKQGIELLEHHPDIRLAISDYEMPHMDGFEFTVNARKRWSKDQLAIIGLSASGLSDLGAMFIKNGANDFLFKPYSFEELTCRINTNIEALEHLDHIHELANKDSLTKLFNRRYFFSSGHKIYEDSKSNGVPLTLVMLDIDFFKQVNDTYGHDGGDIVLLSFAKQLKAHFKDHLVSRLGGEEFAIIIKGLPDNAAYQLLETFRERVEGNIIEWQNHNIQVTVSIGANADYCHDLDAMLKCADENVYKAKEGGRNCVKYSI